MLEKMKSFAKVFPYYIFNRLHNHPVYLQGLMPVLGWFYFIFHRRFYRIFFFYIAFFLVGACLALFFKDYISFLRVGQGLGLIGFVHFLSHYFSKKELDQMAFLALCITSIYAVIEAIFPLYNTYKDFFGHKFPIAIFYGTLGDSNFTASMLLSFGVIYLAQKRYAHFLWACCLIFLTQSRGGIFASVFSLFLFLEFIFSTKIWERLLKGILLAILSYPIWIYLLYTNLSHSTQALLHRLTSARFGIHSTYVKMFLEHPLGIGYFRGKEYYSLFGTVDRDSSLARGDLAVICPLEQHSIFIQALAEFGIVGYLFFALFLWSFLHLILKIDRRLAWSWLAILLSFLVINGLNGFGLYFFMAYIVVLAKRDEKNVLLLGKVF